MALTTNQIIKLARKKMLETTNEIVDDETVLIYANLTNDDIVQRSFPSSIVKSATINFTGGVGTLPADFGTLYGDPYANSFNIYPELSIQDFTRGNYGVTIEQGQLKIYPTNTTLVYIKYFPTFPTLTTAVNPTIPSYLHELIIYGILYRAYEDLQDESLAKYYRDKYEEEFTLKRDAVSSYEETSQRGGVMFNGIQIIREDSSF